FLFDFISNTSAGGLLTIVYPACCQRASCGNSYRSSDNSQRVMLRMRIFDLRLATRRVRGAVARGGEVGGRAAAGAADRPDAPRLAGTRRNLRAMPEARH